MKMYTWYASIKPGTYWYIYALPGVRFCAVAGNLCRGTDSDYRDFISPAIDRMVVSGTFCSGSRAYLPIRGISLS